jgi:hypothetical protein
VARVIRIFDGPIFAILSPTLGPPTLGGCSVGGEELQYVGVQYFEVGSSWRILASVETTFFDRVQGAVTFGGNLATEETARRLETFIHEQRREELTRSGAERFEKFLDYVKHDDVHDDSESEEVVATGKIRADIEGIATEIDTWTAGSWSLGAFEGVFKGRLVAVKIAIDRFRISDCEIGFVSDLDSFADSL